MALEQPRKISFADAALEVERICDEIEDLEEIDERVSSLFSEAIENLSETVDRRVRFLDYLDSQIKQATENVDIFHHRKKILEKTKDQVKQRTVETIKANPKLKFKGTLGSLILRRSTSVEISDISLVPSGFKEIRSVEIPNKNGIKDAILRLGASVPGASLIERDNLQIKK